MNITVKLTRSDQTKVINVQKNSTVAEVLKKIKLKPDTVITMIEDKPVPITQKLKKNQEITIIQVSSGG